jgi:hypothetical protein
LNGTSRGSATRSSVMPRMKRLGSRIYKAGPPPVGSHGLFYR